MYFESLMTCARVRAYEGRREEKKQQKEKSDSQTCSVKVRSHTVTSMYYRIGRNIENIEVIFPQKLLHNARARLTLDGDRAVEPGA